VSDAAEQMEAKAGHLSNVTYTAPTETGGTESVTDGDSLAQAVPRVGRNDPCPCGSGKKYKQCHGRLT
ncbi:MAG: SEC-C metal-binding domain-containing protein, partial [Hydrogenophaga sp.]